MDKIKINIWQLSVEDKMRWASVITETISRNAFLPSAQDLTQLVKKTTEDLRAACQAAAAWRKESLEKAARLVEMEERWNQVMTEVVHRLRTEVKAQGERTADFSGFYLQETSQPEPMPDLAVSMGDTEGTLDVVFDPVRGADVYEIHINLSSDQQAWSLKAISVTSRATLSGLPSGQRCWVRVRPVGSMGIGPWSDSVSKIVP